MEGYNKGLVGHILMKFLLQACKQIQTSQIIKEPGCSTEKALLSGGSRFEDNECKCLSIANHHSAFYMTGKQSENLIPQITTLKLQ